MLHSIRFKVFVVIFLANSILTLSILVANGLNFQQGFKKYVNQAEARMINQLTTELSHWYAQNQGWEPFADNPGAWHQLLRQMFLQSNFKFDRERQVNERGNDPKPRFRPFKRLVLKDQNSQMVIGRVRDQDKVRWFEISDPGQHVIGYLGLKPGRGFNDINDQVFARKQLRGLAMGAGLSLLLAMLVTIPFSGWLVKPVHRLRSATHSLTNGDYQTRIDTKGQDELSQLAQDFNRLAFTLSENLKARQQWVSDISHELRTPVATLQAELEAVLDSVRVLGTSAIQSLHQEVLRLGRLVEDLHQLSLSEAGALTYQMQNINLSKIIEGVLHQHQDHFQQHHFEVRSQVSEQIFMLGDSQRLIQLFSNLVENSLKYTKSSQQKPGQLWINSEQTKNKIRIIWSDSSPGVEDRHLEKLFQRLYRIDDSRNRETGGSGLGLAIVKNIVLAHQGHVKASTSSLGGLSIILEFPMEGAPLK